jgi:hypothetical protein
MERKIDDAELRRLLEPEVARLNDFSIGLVLPSEEKSAIDASLGGSGTLVTIDEVQGILTASHVIERLEKNTHVGLILTEATLHHLSFKVQDCSHFGFACRGEPAKGPDIGLLIPPRDVLSTLSAKKSFYNLSMRRERMLHNPPPLEHGLWILSGLAGEWTGEDAPEHGFARVKRFKGLHLNVKVTKEYDQERFDYLACEVLYNDVYEGPDSYGGYSGGGLWQLLVTPDGDVLRVADRLLSGVAFYQSPKSTNSAAQTVREITCQGRRSLYRDLIDRKRAGYS